VDVFHAFDEVCLAEDEVDRFGFFDFEGGEVHGGTSCSVLPMMKGVMRVSPAERR